MPLFHTAGCATGALGSLQAGCRMLLMEQFSADGLSQRIESEGVTGFFAVPTMLVALLESLDRTPRDMSSLVAITTGGATVAPELVAGVRDRLGCHLLTAFGQTEASPMISLESSGCSAGAPCRQRRSATAADRGLDPRDRRRRPCRERDRAHRDHRRDLRTRLRGPEPLSERNLPRDGGRHGNGSDVPIAPMGPSRLELDKPVIGAIAGPAVAGGMELAMWCDVRVMERSAYMGVYCRRWGIPFIDGGTVRLPRLVGQGRALDQR